MYNHPILLGDYFFQLGRLSKNMMAACKALRNIANTNGGKK
jgi:hypothetical protein